MSKIPEHHLRTVLETLNLLRLMSTQEKPYDQVRDLAQKVGWLGMYDFPARLRRLFVYVQKQVKERRLQLERLDHDEFPERPYRVWCGHFTPDERLGLPKPRPPRKYRRAKQEKKSTLQEQFPWLDLDKPRENEDA